METEQIENIRKKFRNEWLLIAVDETDSATHEPINGHLLAHGQNRKDVHDMSTQFDGVAYIVYSDDWPDDLAACFCVA